MNSPKHLSVLAVLALLAAAPPSFAQDAMSSDDMMGEAANCNDKSGDAMADCADKAAADAMSGDAMKGDAMADDKMSGDAMGEKMAPAK